MKTMVKMDKIMMIKNPAEDEYEDKIKGEDAKKRPLRTNRRKLT
jgi:hypothetical protein